MSRKLTLLTAVGAILAAAAVAENGAGDPNRGFLYGTVETKDGAKHTGVLRWDDEEAFWDDLFHSAKSELPYGDYEEPRGVATDEPWWKRLVRTIGGEIGVYERSRVLAVRFGDLAVVEPAGGDAARLVLRDGTEIEVEGYANDVSADVTVIDDKPGRVEIPWRRIARVTFRKTPADADPGVFRLHGTVTTTAGDYAGFIQWDSQECVSTDRLDGDDAATGERVTLEMGEIRAIERVDRRSSRVVLKDGAEMVLEGTNDVNHDIRGVHVEDPRFGRVEVHWGEFRRVVFDDPSGSGRGYDEYRPPRRLSGVVTLVNGDWRRGGIVFDLDEEWSWEMLDGENEAAEYTIPFVLVASIEPLDADRSRVRLRSGVELILRGSHDVGSDNSGVVVVPEGGGEPGFVPWREVASISFD